MKYVDLAFALWFLFMFSVTAFGVLEPTVFQQCIGMIFAASYFFIEFMKNKENKNG
ncbi:hypothetical protein [Bacillus sp. FJAT-22090]|uniref:hypothetical protein n=1 Tax=Bacillus sp. FJAT-22090 TaxID=1581038 RepID=UPI0016424939|nr:hypothetical protein [Bacillus sp. FJAT-22090]